MFLTPLWTLNAFQIIGYSLDNLIQPISN